jgi:hypothetical protein
MAARRSQGRGVGRSLLLRHSDADRLLRRHEVIEMLAASAIASWTPLTRPLNALTCGPYSGETGAPESSPTSQPSLAENWAALTAFDEGGRFEHLGLRFGR